MRKHWRPLHADGDQPTYARVDICSQVYAGDIAIQLKVNAPPKVNLLQHLDELLFRAIRQRPNVNSCEMSCGSNNGNGKETGLLDPEPLAAAAASPCRVVRLEYHSQRLFLITTRLLPWKCGRWRVWELLGVVVEQQ